MADRGASSTYPTASHGGKMTSRVLWSFRHSKTAWIARQSPSILRAFRDRGGQPRLASFEPFQLLVDLGERGVDNEGVQRRWSWLLQSSTAFLPSLVEIELRGIPAHAWEVDTAEKVNNSSIVAAGLVEFILIRQGVETSTRITAWCSSPGHIPESIDLEIVEPPVAGDDPRPLRHSLIYPVDVSVSFFE
ncbi:hypothetical protein C2845_PM13G10250 [Panicum miliaceum]|uniref:Uncharacterized protein n=1 Tax=Panicum miliaceum TaxID=4540 RepID=A0A3L6RGQ9_PANMI|nr:hypothetical protein C2845_PM13G10250 [Panicum miliaceum]